MIVNYYTKGTSMTRRRLRNRSTTWRVALAIACSSLLAAPAVAAAVCCDDHFGPTTVGGSGGYIQSPAAHTYNYMRGSSVGAVTYLACQFLGGSINQVSHGYAYCSQTYPGGTYVWSRVYDQSAFSDTLSGFATTNG